MFFFDLLDIRLGVVIAVVIVLVVMIDLSVKKEKKVESRFEYPPQERIFQFGFSLGSFLVFGLGGPIIFFSAYFEYQHDKLALMLMQGSIFLMAIFSFFALFAPFVTPVLFILYGVFGYAHYIAEPRIKENPGYEDRCQEYRDDSHCMEFDKSFVCTEFSKKGQGRFSKDLCIIKIDRKAK